MIFQDETEKKNMLEEIQKMEKDKYQNLEKAINDLKDFMMHFPQQFPTLLYIKNEIEEFKKKMDHDIDQKLKIIQEFDSNDSSSSKETEYSSNTSYKNLKSRCSQIYECISQMFLVNFYNIFQNAKEILLNQHKNIQQKDILKYFVNFTGEESPEYWPLKIREFFLSSLKEIDEKYEEAISYFEANYPLFIFISKFDQTFTEISNLYESMFDQDSSPRKIVLDAYVQNIIKMPRNCLSFVESINQNVNFDKFTNTVAKLSKNSK